MKQQNKKQRIARRAIYAVALMLAAATARAAVYVHDSVATYTAGSITTKAPSALGFTGAWSGSTGVFLADTTTSLNYPDTINALSAGGRIILSNAQLNQTTGRTTSRSIADSGLPSSGPLYFGVLLAIDATSFTQLAGRPSGYAQYVGVRTSDLNSGNSSTVPTFPSAGVFVGFTSTGSDVGLTLGVNGTSYPLLASVSAEASYFCVVKIDPQAGGNGKEVITAVVNPSAPGLLGGPGSATAEAEVLATGTTFTHVTLGGYYATNNGKTSFDEVTMTDTEADIAPMDDADFAVSASAATDITCISATANGTVTLTSGAADVFLDWGRTEAFENTLSLGEFTESAVLAQALDNLRPDTSYFYRYRADNGAGAVTSAFTIAFSTPGAVTFSDVSASNALTTAYLNGTVSHASVAPTAVTLWFGETGGSLAMIQSWSDVANGAVLSHTVADAAWGGSYDYAFQAEYRYNGETFTYWSATNTAQIVGAATWTGAGENHDWSDPANWNIGAVPSPLIEAVFDAVANGSVITSSTDIAGAKKITVTASPLSFDLGTDTALTVYGDMSVASRKKTSLISGTLSVTNRVQMQWGATVMVETGAVFETGSILLQYDDARVTVKGGGRFKTFGNAEAWTGNPGNGFTVLTGAVWEANGITLAKSTSMLVDGGVVTNSNSLTTGGRNDDDLTFTYKEVEIANNGLYKQTGGTFTLGTWFTTGALVRDGGVMEVDGDVNIGSTNTGGDDMRLVVSNATLRAGALRVCPDNRYHSNKFLVYEDAGRSTTVDIAGDLRLGAATGYTIGTNNAVRIFGGNVSIGGAFTIGAASGPASNNVFQVSGPDAHVTAASLNMQNHSRLVFEIAAPPVTPPVVIAGNVSLDATTRLTIDARACNAAGVFTLLQSTAGVFNYAIPEENVTLLFRAGSQGELLVSAENKTLAVRISQTGTVVVIQ